MKLIIRRYELILLTVVCLLCGSAVVTTEQDVISIPYEPKDLINSKTPTQSCLIVLTFDDGPHPFYTQKLISLLKRHKVPATFFVVGSQVEKYPNLLKEIALNNFELGGHTYSHRDMTTLSKQEIIDELEKTRLLIKAHTQRDVYIYRPPGGRFNETTKKVASQLGYEMILWDILPRDHENLTSREIYNRVTKNIKQGGIVLLHSGKDATIEALEEIIPELKSRGYSFVTVSQYMAYQ